jgi:hypothetical protein
MNSLLTSIGRGKKIPRYNFQSIDFVSYLAVTTTARPYIHLTPQHFWEVTSDSSDW